ncbi:GntR family transcriptional regulator [Pseudomonas retamae]|uniref:GntR family transcriptional regulator n=1 Tax=Pseudomonas retamae TaxID=702110 RepID=A0ABW7DGE5_9PSED
MNSVAATPHAHSAGAPLPFTRLRGAVNDLYPRLLEAILEQRITPASRFTEDSLQAMFSAGRADVRRVLTQLSHEQIVVLRANHRPRVAAPDRDLIRQTLHARRLAENTLVRLACQSPQPDDLECLRTLIERGKRAIEQDRRGAAIRLSGEFHLQLARMAGNVPLTHFLRSLVPLTSLAIARNQCSTRSCCASQEHLALVEVVERGDASKAGMLMNRHLDHLEQTLLGTTFQHCVVS